ncbi:insulinase family protein [Patescibacteria group bacterium]|nr:insulinase family protein [Patescibacteria group bacterium]
MLRETIREDGLRIITKKLSRTKKLMIVIMVELGSLYDPSNRRGLAHFLEHTLFKGAADGAKKYSAIDIRLTTGNRLLSFDACTGKFALFYFAEILGERFDELIDFLICVYNNPLFPPEEIEKEKEVVTLEIIEEIGDDYENINYELKKLLWGKNSLFSANITGDIKDLKNLKRKDLVRWHKAWFIPSNTAIVGIGDVDHLVFSKRINDLIKINNKAKPRILSKHQIQKTSCPVGKEGVFEYENKERAMIGYAWKIIERLSEKEENILSLLYLLMDFTLDMEIRESRGHSYGVVSLIESYHNFGYYLSFVTEVLPAKLNFVMNLFYKILCEQPLEHNYFELKKAKIIDQISVAPEDLKNWLNEIEDKVFLRRWPVKRLDQRIRGLRQAFKSISFDDVVCLRKKILVPDNVVRVVFKPVK